ncbi:hypothetical protein [Bradyrhizobium sp. CB1015]|uniref:hypothetical protein n=1 Tax=Bradyrhizobium sp. CB1015 TaxID=2976822 RepID=UPI0021A9AEB0|nr:hypothetical protein [Bradyrhizobium sp. CB1015]UWU96197.1 hypothetical protein N2604_20830 [Bradyrhizobium sp. CB1015]
MAAIRLGLTRMFITRVVEEVQRRLDSNPDAMRARALFTQPGSKREELRLSKSGPLWLDERTTTAEAQLRRWAERETRLDHPLNKHALIASGATKPGMPHRQDCEKVATASSLRGQTPATTRRVA